MAALGRDKQKKASTFVEAFALDRDGNKYRQKK